MAKHGVTHCGCAALQASTVAMVSLGGRVPQIWMNYQRGNSGELSVTTCMLNLTGSVARVFTTLVLTKVSLCIRICYALTATVWPHDRLVGAIGSVSQAALCMQKIQAWQLALCMLL